MIGYGFGTGSSSARDRGYTMARASLYAQAMTTALKLIVREPRPDRSGENDSFPSGHTTNAFSFASVVSAEHGWYWGALAYSYATVVAYGRINDNRHLTHDVVGGAAVGVSYGLGLYYRQLQRAEMQTTSSSSSLNFQLLPTRRLDGAVALLSREF